MGLTVAVLRRLAKQSDPGEASRQVQRKKDHAGR